MWTKYKIKGMPLLVFNYFAFFPFNINYDFIEKPSDILFPFLYKIQNVKSLRYIIEKCSSKGKNPLMFLFVII